MADTNLLVLAREYKKLREEVKKVLSMPKGDKGDQGEKGEKGDTGDTGPQGFPGRDGKDGINGYDGKDGLNGNDGKDGKDGLDGVGVQNAYIDFDNSLVIVLTDGREVNAGYLSQETKDNVVATFKQGAATINELLPSQSGNTDRVLRTNGTSVYWSVNTRSVDITTASTITPTSDTADQYEVTALATAATIAAPAGTPTDGQKLILRFKDNGAARALTWTTTSGAYRAVGVTLPANTVLSKVLYIGCVWNAQDNFWDVIAVAQQA